MSAAKALTALGLKKRKESIGEDLLPGDEQGAAGGFGAKTIGVVAGTMLITNNVTGPGLVALSYTFQQGGWLTRCAPQPLPLLVVVLVVQLVLLLVLPPAAAAPPPPLLTANRPQLRADLHDDDRRLRQQRLHLRVHEPVHTRLPAVNS